MRAIDSDPSLTTCELASKLRCTHGARHYQFKQLSLVSKLGQWVPYDLSHDQNKKRVDSIQQLILTNG